MTNFGYTLMTEQSGPKELVAYAAAAERVGFDFEVSSDHYSPWLVSQGHAPYAWTVLGAVAVQFLSSYLGAAGSTYTTLLLGSALLIIVLFFKGGLAPALWRPMQRAVRNHKPSASS